MGRVGRGGAAAHHPAAASGTLFIRGRHMQISTWVSSQKLRLISAAVRVNMQFLCCWRLRNQHELDAVIEELSALLPKEQLYRLYEQATREPYSFLFVYYLKPRNEMFYKRFEERFKPLLPGRFCTVQRGPQPSAPAAHASASRGRLPHSRRGHRRGRAPTRFVEDDLAGDPEAGALASNGQGPPSITDRLRSTADGAQAAADLIGAGAAGLAAAQAFRSQLPQDAAEYVRRNVLPRPGPAQPPPQIIGRPSDVERLLDEAGQSAARRQ